MLVGNSNAKLTAEALTFVSFFLILFLFFLFILFNFFIPERSLLLLVYSNIVNVNSMEVNSTT